MRIATNLLPFITHEIVTSGTTLGKTHVVWMCGFRALECEDCESFRRRGTCSHMLGAELDKIGRYLRRETEVA